MGGKSSEEMYTEKVQVDRVLSRTGNGVDRDVERKQEVARARGETGKSGTV